MGPLLFVIFINDLQNNTNLRVPNFADDTILYTIVNKSIYIQDTTNFNVEL